MEVKPLRQGSVPAGYKQTERGVIPKDWVCPSIKEVAAKRPNAIVGGPFGSDLVSKDYVDTGVPVVRGQNMARQYVSGEFVFVSRSKGKQLQANMAHADDVIFTQRGTLGQVSIVPRGPFEGYLVSQSQMKLTLNSNVANCLYVYQYFTSPDGQRQILDSAIQTGVPHTNLGILRFYKIPLPPTKAEQEAIAEALSDADALIESLEQLLAKKRQLKQGAMQELLTGKKHLPGFSGEWGMKRLGDISPLQRGFDLPTTKISLGSYPVVYSNGVLNYHDQFMVKGPGVVTGRSGTIGNVHFVEDNFWPHNTSLWVTNFKGNSPKYIFYLLTYIGLEKFGTGSGVPTLNRNDVHAHKALLPPTTNEQTAIAAILSDMDAEIAEIETKLTKARQLKQGMMQELLTGRIRLV